MINESPWGIGRRTARNMTQRNVNGQWILSGKRAAGTFTPSPETLAAQAVARILWPIFRFWTGSVRHGWTSKLQKQPAASAWYGSMFKNAITGFPVTPVLDPTALQVAKGSIAPTVITATISAATQTLAIAWNTSIVDDSQLGTDILGFALYNVDTGYLYSQNAGLGTKGGAGVANVLFDVGTFTVGDVVRVIPFFYGAPSTANQGKSSDSVNLGVTVGV